MGLQGAKGATGPQGPDGPPGPESDYRPKFWVSCGAGLDLLTLSGPGQDGSVESELEYSLTLYTTRDVSVSCLAGAGSREGNGTEFYPSVVAGSKTGGCNASLDLPPYPAPPSNEGLWRFEIGQAGPGAAYEDEASHPLNGFKHVFSDNECTALLLDPDLTWKEVTLAAAFAH